MYRDLPVSGSESKAGLLKAKLLAAAVYVTSLASVAFAETTTSRFVCALDNDGRIVELTFLGQVGKVPCEIRETRYNGATKTLWRADFDPSFCQSQLDTYRAKLRSLGWPCESILTDTPELELSGRLANFDRQTGSIEFPKSPERTLSNTTTAYPVPNADVTNFTGNGKINADTYSTLQFSEEVFIYESDVTDYGATSETPVAPKILEGYLSQDDIRQLDDWLIYLSAQSMASIRQAMPDPEAFESYQLNEDLNSDDIYKRLQNRIEFLHNLVISR